MSSNIQHYYTKVEQIIWHSGSQNESSLRKPVLAYAAYFVHSPWFIGKNCIISIRMIMIKKKCWCGFPSRFGFIPKQSAVRDRGFVQKCPIDEPAVRNYFPCLFSGEN